MSSISSPVCSNNKRLLTNGCLEFSKTDKFIQLHKSKSSFRWKYCKVFYENYGSLISLTCPVHGIQKPKSAEYLLKGYGCKRCAVSELKIKSLEEKVLQFSRIHENRYDYSLIKSKKILSTDIIEILCPIHGTFKQRVSAHMDGQGCPKCAIENRMVGSSLFLSKIQEVNSDVSFSPMDFVNMTTPMAFDCQKHGSFVGAPAQVLNNILICPMCGRDVGKDKIRLPFEYFVEKANIIHGNKYTYTKQEVENTKTKFSVTCPIHGDFLTSWNYHVHGKNGCPKCGGGLSNEEDNIFKFISSMYEGPILSRYKPDFLNGKELDIYIPELSVAIEYNGSYWHSDKYKDKWYHFEKWKACRDNNVKLLNIWEHYWNKPRKRSIYKHKIIHLLGLDERIYARKCSIVSIDRLFYDNFIENNHLDGKVLPYKSMKYIGLSYNGRIVMVAGYGNFYNQSLRSFNYKLQRICTLIGLTITGGVSKLTKYIKDDIGDFQFQITLDTGGSLLSADKDKSDISLRYWWVNNRMEYKTRNECQISKLKLNSDWEDHDTEKSYMEKNKWFRVFDTGVVSI